MSRPYAAKRFCLCLLAIAMAAPLGAETPAERDARMRWWRDAKFGMFIHWGVYAVPAGTYQGERIGGIGEWIMRNAQIPVDEYRGYARRFNPTEYDPEAWAKLAKEAGMRYVVITSKHHDGFALYDSDVTEWDVADATPYGKGLLQPLAEAVRGEGLKFGLYYSQAQDWTHPGGAKAGLDEGEGWDEEHQGSFDEYLERIALPQSKEILTRFRPDVLWWDTPVWMNERRAAPLHALLADHPGIITNNRLGGGYEGDTETPEQHIPATGFDQRDWETCMTMNDTWGFKSYDDNWKSTETLVHNLVDIVSKGGNYLLNVGPTAQGEIPQPSIERLREIGAWMDKNGEAIYATTASPCRRPAWGRITRKGDRLFLHVFDWPSSGRLVAPIKVDVESCRLLVEPSRAFETASSDDGLVVKLTGEAVDPMVTVVELRISGEPTEVVQRVKPDANGRLVLSAGEAHIDGRAQVEEIGGRMNIGYWTDASDRVRWRCVIPEAGAYQVTAEVAGPARSMVQIDAGGERRVQAIAPTGSYQEFATQDLGELRVAQAGETTVEVRPVRDMWNAINLRSVTLTPAE